MKTTQPWLLTVLLLAISVPSVSGESGLGINEVVKAGGQKTYSHPEMVVLTDGFWAKTGSNVTVRTALSLLQMSNEPPPSPPRDPNITHDRSPIPFHAEYSGVPGTKSVEVDIGLNAKLTNPANYYAINAIEVSEMGNNNPCLLRLWGNMVDPRYSKDQERLLVARYELDKCSPVITTIDHKLVGFQPSQKRFIRALQVCIGHTFALPQELYVGGKWEIKGLRVRPGSVQSNREGVTSVNKVHEFKRPNCLKQDAIPGPGDLSQPGWSAWNSCGPDQLATGVTLYIWKDKFFSGMAIKCKYVRQLSGSAPAEF